MWYERGRQVIRRWHNTDGELHRTTGPAVEVWTVLPGGAHVLSYQGWFLNGQVHREGRPAAREWQVANDGARALVWEEWARHERGHRVDGPSTRCWTMKPDGTRRLAWETWQVDGVCHRVDGPVQDGRSFFFFWHGAVVTQRDLPWLRRGEGLLTVLAAVPKPAQRDGCTSPAWSRDERVAMTGADSVSSPPALPTYRSAVGGSVLLCV